jgi:hypothetical protein
MYRDTIGQKIYVRSMRGRDFRSALSVEVDAHRRALATFLHQRKGAKTMLRVNVPLDPLPGHGKAKRSWSRRSALTGKAGSIHSANCSSCFWGNTYSSRFRRTGRDQGPVAPPFGGGCPSRTALLGFVSLYCRCPHIPVRQPNRRCAPKSTRSRNRGPIDLDGIPKQGGLGGTTGTN